MSKLIIASIFTSASKSPKCNLPFSVHTAPQFSICSFTSPAVRVRSKTCFTDVLWISLFICLDQFSTVQTLFTLGMNSYAAQKRKQPVTSPCFRLRTPPCFCSKSHTQPVVIILFVFFNLTTVTYIFIYQSHITSFWLML